MKQRNRASQASAADTTPAAVAGYRQRLTLGESVISAQAWAGSVPAAQGIGPRVRVGRSKWFNVLWLLPIGWAALIIAVAGQGLRNMPAVQRFRARYPGTMISPVTHPGLPWRVEAQHRQALLGEPARPGRPAQAAVFDRASPLLAPRRSGPGQKEHS